jgi:hypothetical protein
LAASVTDPPPKIVTVLPLTEAEPEKTEREVAKPELANGKVTLNGEAPNVFAEIGIKGAIC